MTEELRRSRMTANANSLIRNRANSGISWGTNNYPAYSIPDWFAGTTAGSGAAWSNDSWGDQDKTNATNVINALKYVTNLFGSIRNTRIVIYRSHYSLGQKVVSDQTAVANVVAYVPEFANNVAMPFANGNEMNLADFDKACEDLWVAYALSTRFTTLTLTNTICHTSCHSSCHSNRGRR